MRLWHALPLQEVWFALRSSPEGFSSQEAKARRIRYGPNRLREADRDGAWRVAARQFTDPLILILIAAGLVSAGLGDMLDAAIIGAAVVVNAVVGFVQERKVSSVMAELRSGVHETAIVLREGSERLVAAADLVPGDVVVLKQGSRVPADGRVIRSSGLQTTEAALTGESFPVEKSSRQLPKDTALSDRANMVYLGTLVAQGTGLAVIVATGMFTELGTIAALVARERGRDRTPLQIRLRRLAVVMSIMFIAVALLLFGLGTATGIDPLVMFLTAAAVAVAAVPESLPVALGVALAIGARRILKHGGLVRRMIAAETLGSVTVIATDKTATLTEGVMRLSRLEMPDGRLWMPGIELDDDVRRTTRLLALASDAFVENPDAPVRQWRLSGSPVSQAALWAAIEARIDVEALRSARIAELPFDARHKYSAMLARPQEGRTQLIVLGAPEAIAAASTARRVGSHVLPMGEDDRAALLKRGDELAAMGFRLLGMASRTVSDDAQQVVRDDVRELAWNALIALSDPVRADVPPMVRDAREAGVRLIMVTGDHARTAEYVGHQTGILTGPSRVIEGRALPEDCTVAVDAYDVFARVSPSDKVRIVDALKMRGHSVAMLGDGVNDAPSLLRADIGVAVGSGTDVAKDASDLVLLGDSFSIVVHAIRQGRIIFDNIAKVMLFLLSDAFSEIMLVGVSVVAGLPLPLLPAQILWVNIIEDVLPAIALAVDHSGNDVMRQPPRRIADLLSGRFRLLIVAFSVVINVGLLALFTGLLATSAGLAHVRTMVFLSLGFTSLLYVFSVRALWRPLWRTRLFGNRWLNASVLAGIGLYAVALYVPFFNRILGTVPLTVREWALVAGIGVLMIIVFEALKLLIAWQPARKEKTPEIALGGPTAPVVSG